MSDYKGIFAQEEMVYKSNKSGLGIYQISVVKRSNTKDVFWTGEVDASSPKNAQQKWRQEYPEVRKKFDHSYALIIKKIEQL